MAATLLATTPALAALTEVTLRVLTPALQSFSAQERHVARITLSDAGSGVLLATGVTTGGTGDTGRDLAGSDGWVLEMPRGSPSTDGSSRDVMPEAGFGWFVIGLAPGMFGFARVFARPQQTAY